MRTNNKNSIFQCIISVAAVCLVFAVMQGIHDNYGIMLGGIIKHTNISYGL